MTKIGKATLLASASALWLLALPYTAGAMGMGHGAGMGMGRGMMGGAAARHHYVMRHGVPPEYAGKTNPLPATPDNIEAGRRLFAENCATCHGASGRGDGPAAKDLHPPPADLAAIRRRPMVSDSYLYWTIAEGGARFRTAMPSMKDALTDSDIWKLIVYLRQL